MTIAYQGAPGAFSHEACLRFMPEEPAIAFATFGEVVAAVQDGAAEFGMLPLSNNEAGETGARALIGKSDLRIVARPVLDVRMHLLGLPSTTLGQIGTVVSHPIALRQCAASLARLGVATEETSNTAIAAKALRTPRRAVLASEAAAEIYGLAILERDVHDRADNATEFAIVARPQQ